MAFKRAGMEGKVVALEWGDILTLARAHGLDEKVAALLLQSLELKLVLAINGEGGDDEF